MPTHTLAHCQPVRIHESQVPGDVVLHLTVGGAPGEGTVDVIAVPGPAQPATRATADAGPHQAAGCTGLSLHYRSAQSSGSVVVSWTLTLQ